MSTNDLDNNINEKNNIIESISQPIDEQPVNPELDKSAPINKANQHIQYNTPLQCPRCGNLSYQRFCSTCNLDLAPYQQIKQQQYQPQQPYTGSYYNNMQPNYYIPQYNVNNQQKKPIKIGLIISGSIGLFIVLFALSFMLNSYIINRVHNPNQYNKSDNGYISPNDPEINPSGVSQSEFRKLKIGMSYARVSAIIGGDGVNSADGETPYGEKYYTFTWFGETNPNAKVHITFTNDKVSDIVDDGLIY